MYNDDDRPHGPTKNTSGEPSSVGPETDASNAFTVLSQSLAGNENTAKLVGLDIPKKISEFNEIRGMASGISIAVVGLVVAIVCLIFFKNIPIAIVILLGGLLMGGVTFVLSLIGFRRLRQSEKRPAPAYNNFQTGTDVTYRKPSAQAVIDRDETLAGWLGPVTVQGSQGIGWEILSKEQSGQSVNTLLFTNKRVVALLLGPQDVPASLAGGMLNQIASTAIMYSNQAATEKNVQLDALYSGKWAQIMASVLAQPLSTLPDNHLSYAIPYDAIQKVQVKRTFINPGLIFYIKDGTKSSFSVFRKEILDEAEACLRPVVTVE
jgi:hypothetical protein